MSRAKAATRRGTKLRAVSNLAWQLAAIEEMDVDDIADDLGQTPAEVRAGLSEAITLGLLRVESITADAVVLRGTFPGEDA